MLLTQLTPLTQPTLQLLSLNFITEGGRFTAVGRFIVVYNLAVGRTLCGILLNTRYLFLRLFFCCCDVQTIPQRAVQLQVPSTQ